MSFADSKTYNYIQSSSFILIKIILDSYEKNSVCLEMYEIHFTDGKL